MGVFDFRIKTSNTSLRGSNFQEKDTVCLFINGPAGGSFSKISCVFVILKGFAEVKIDLVC